MYDEMTGSRDLASLWASTSSEIPKASSDLCLSPALFYCFSSPLILRRDPLPPVRLRWPTPWGSSRRPRGPSRRESWTLGRFGGLNPGGRCADASALRWTAASLAPLRWVRLSAKGTPPLCFGWVMVWNCY